MAQPGTALASKGKTSLVDFLEHDTKAIIDSPRSLQACAGEGVAPQDLIYKPIEAFAEKGLEPRLVKLRYDFFEAKRNDLLAACRRSREIILEEEGRERNHSMTGMTLAEMSRAKGISTGVLSAMQSDCVKQERSRLQHAQHLQLQWLQNCLAHQLHQTKMLEKADQFMQAEEADEQQGNKDAAERMRKKNEEKRMREEQKMAELAAQQKLEQQIAKEEFERQQEELEHEKQLAEQRRKEAHARSMADQAAKKKAEEDKAERRRQAWMHQQRQLEEMRANDERRNEIRRLQKAKQNADMEARRKFKEDRIALSKANLGDKTGEKMAAFMAKQNHEQAREDRLNNLRLLQQEEGARRGFQVMMKRKAIMDEADRKAEEKRNSIIEHQNEVEHRMMLHEMKKERYLEFKAELDALKEKNKEINVIRQRRKEDQKREDVAEAVRRKDDKIEMLHHERDFLWGLRRTTGAEIARAKDEVKQLITSMKIKSNYDAHKVEGTMRKIFKRKIFNTDFGTVQSMPDLGLGPQGTQGAVEDYAAGAGVEQKIQ
ncbi:unnamed protein product [Amoebophrya sp. A120]|nr:unnamed protein product [Amoebophrya sp. A120]|eukprot:GSA120T00021492001.1